MKQKIISIILSIAMTLTMIPTMVFAADKNSFTDVSANAFYYDAVLWAVNHDPVITNGTDPTHFSPNATCTRGQVVTFLWRSAGEPEPSSSENPFTDVKADAYYYDAVLWAVEKGITTGTSKTSFSPADNCTRGQVVTFLYRTVKEPSVKNVSNPFNDVSDKGYYYNAVLWAVVNEVTSGTSATTFSPENTCTRGQIVTFLYRARDFLTGLDYSDEVIEQEIETVTDLNQDLADIASEYDITDNAQETADNAEAVMQEMLDYCDEQKEAGEIVDYDQDGCLIIIQLDIGKFVYEFQPFPELQGGGSGSAAALCSEERETDSDELSEKAQLLSGTFDVSKIVTIEPFKSQFNTDIFDNAAKAIENAGLGYEFSENVNGGEVTAEFAKFLDDYKVIIWNGHGSYSEQSDMHSILGLGEICSKYNFERYIDDLNNDRIVYFGDAKNRAEADAKKVHYGITTKFFEYYYDSNSFKGTLFYLGTCCSAQDNALAQTLLDKGAEAVIGYSNPVHPSYNQAMFQTIFDQLLKIDVNGNSLTVKQALEEAKKKHGDLDPHWTRNEQAICEMFSSYPTSVFSRNITHAKAILIENDSKSYRLSEFGFIIPGGDPNVQGGTITDSWDQIIASVNKGTYKSKYKIGDTKALDLGSGIIVEMQIAAFDADELADGSGNKAAITWISKQLIPGHRMNPERETDASNSSKYKSGTGNIGGWEHSEMRAWLKSDIKPLLPATVRNAIKSVKKYSASYDTSGKWKKNAMTVDDVWIPSYREIDGSSSDFETMGPTYTGLFSSDSDRVKQISDYSVRNEWWDLEWWLRSSDDYFVKDYSQCADYRIVNADGSLSASYNADSETGVAIGFCM